MKNRGMTLVELVVVAGVVVLAAALFLPALASVSVKDDLTTCLRRSLNLSNAILQYAADNDGILPPGKHPIRSVKKIWSGVLYELQYVETKEEFQCPADDVTNNGSMYFGLGPYYPHYWSSYALPMNLFDLQHTPVAAVLANHEGMLDKQVLLGESESDFISADYFGRGGRTGHNWFIGAYLNQFPFARHEGFCTYLMLDGHAKAMRVPSSDAVDGTQFESEIRAQFEKCSQESLPWNPPDSWHVCFWNRYKRGLEASAPYGN